MKRVRPTPTSTIVIVKLGGSSITVKSEFETLNEKALQWVSQSIKSAMDKDANKRFIIVHGAGSFGHHTAKLFGLSGKSCPHISVNMNTSSTYDDNDDDDAQVKNQMQGLAETRLSVLKLNHAVVNAFIREGVPAVGISPFSVGLQAHGGNENGGMSLLADIVKRTIDTGCLVPVIHGDACFYGEKTQHQQIQAGILSGDIIVADLAREIISDLYYPKDDSKMNNINMITVRTIFLTDVDGVYTRDPATCTDTDDVKKTEASLLPLIIVDSEGNVIASNVKASQSQHDCDVTGGFVTKLDAAAAIASADAEVVIVRCGSEDAKLALCGEAFIKGTLVRKAK